MNSARSTVRSLLRLVVVACAIGTSAVYADDYTAINTLLKQKKADQALVAVNKRIDASPRDPQLLFLRGVAQSDLGQTDDAIETFTNLTQLYPELPEPYNNLAVLYAGRNELEKARRSLEMAVRGNPNYATAYENLGDIYVRLAAESFEKAQHLDGRLTPSVAPKLTQLRQLVGANGTNGATAAKAAPKASTNTATGATGTPASTGNAASAPRN